jgi:hypothetical protein
MMMEMILILVMVMERPPLCQGGEVVKMAAISPFSGAPERQDRTPLEGRHCHDLDKSREK